MPSTPSAPGPLEDAVRLVLDPARDVGVGRAAVGRVVLEPAVVWWVVRRRHDDPVGQVAPAVLGPVGDEDGVRDGRGRSESIGRVDAGIDPACHEHAEGRGRRRFGQCVSVAADEQRPAIAALHSIAAYRLGRRQDVGLVERVAERRAAMPRRPERHPLGRVGRVGSAVVIGRQQGVDIDEDRRVGGLTSPFAEDHPGMMSRAGTRSRRFPAAPPQTPQDPTGCCQNR